MIVIIRISGMVDVPQNVNHTLHHINLRRKYSAILMPETLETAKILKAVRSFVAFGKINDEMLAKLIQLRGERIENKGKVDADAVIKGLDKKNLRELGMKPFFRLHPPRKGIESKKHFGVGKGVLGNNKEHINLLLERML